MLIEVWRKEKAMRYGVAVKILPWWMIDSNLIGGKRKHMQEERPRGNHR